MINVLILCTGNSCRSVIGEALFNHLGEGRIKAWSAGSFPTGTVNPNATSVLGEHGISTLGLSSKSWDELGSIEFDIVITVCDNAQGETCPVYLNKAIKAHWGLPDPADVIGNGKEIMEAFETTYLALQNRITMMLKLPLELMSEKEIKDSLEEIGTEKT
ncbi:MAG: arsenate reductase ArsC [Gammaproteobacteria bacterium]|jgi:arsenate reductase (thioredoxin)|nr:arsenate reductase ArsC [Gammaproteobacteria bacterium]